MNLELPTEELEFKQKLVERGLLHFSDQCSETICQQAAEQLYKDRSEAKNKGITNLPGQAEYLDMMRALSLLGENDEAKQRDMLDKIAKFTFVKYPKAYGR
jgi:hypothetical protein